MDGDTPREMIRRLLRSSAVETTGKQVNLRKAHPLANSSKQKLSAKRQAQVPLGSAAKRKRQSVSTPSDTITPRTTIKKLLSAAVNETPAVKPAQTNTRKVQQQPQSAITDTQFQRLVGSSRRSSTGKITGSVARRRSRRNFSTPSEMVTPRANIKTFLKAAESETPAEPRLGGSSEAGTAQPTTDYEEAALININQEELPSCTEVETGSTFKALTKASSESLEPGEPIDEASEVSNVLFDVSSQHETSTSSSSMMWGSLQTPVLPDVDISMASPALPVCKPPLSLQHRKPSRNVKTSGRRGSKHSADRKSDAARLPDSLVKGIFSHFSTLRLSADALEAIQKGSEKFFENTSSDLMTYCKHAKRKKIEQADVELLMHRQGLISSKQSFNALIEKYLPMEYREEIIPCPAAYNKVYPKPNMTTVNS